MQNRHLEARLDPHEQHFRIASPAPGLSLFLRYLPPNAEPARGTVLYVHGATFPSALSIAHRFDGRSWRDELTAAGFHVWGLDFLGFGGSDRYPAMADPPEAHAPLCDTEDASRQVDRAVRFICEHQGIERLSIIAHSWGTIVTSRVAARYPGLVDRLVLFGPIARREGVSSPPASPAWRSVSLRDQWERFTADVPADAAPVLSPGHFAAWGEAYLETDPDSGSRTPPAVRIPCGPWHAITRAWAGDLEYDLAAVKAPVQLIRGAWDSMCTDSDAGWLFDRFTSASILRDVKIARATHLMHLEAGRYALYREARSFLEGRDDPPQSFSPA
jgi:pimeloyl-ACP methyl ester carboxylesterase